MRSIGQYNKDCFLFQVVQLEPSAGLATAKYALCANHYVRTFSLIFPNNCMHTSTGKEALKFNIVYCVLGEVQIHYSFTIMYQQYHQGLRAYH